MKPSDLLAVLKEVEWSDYFFENNHCPICESTQGRGHIEGCRLSAAIADCAPLSASDVEQAFQGVSPDNPQWSQAVADVLNQ